MPTEPIVADIQAKSRPEEPFLARRNHMKPNRFSQIFCAEVFLLAILHKFMLGIWGVSDQSKVALSWFGRVFVLFCSHGRCWLLGTTRTSLWHSFGLWKSLVFARFQTFIFRSTSSGGLGRNPGKTPAEPISTRFPPLCG